MNREWWRYILLPFIIFFYLIGLGSLKLCFALMGEGWQTTVTVDGLPCYFNPNRD